MPHTTPYSAEQAASTTRTMPWYTLTLIDGMVGYAETDLLRDRFIDAFVSAGEPADMAVFIHHEWEAGLAIHWFSPSAWGVAEKCKAVPCGAEPDARLLTLFMGEAGAWKALFPHQIPSAAQEHGLHNLGFSPPSAPAAGDRILFSPPHSIHTTASPGQACPAP